MSHEPERISGSEYYMNEETIAQKGQRTSAVGGPDLCLESASWKERLNGCEEAPAKSTYLFSIEHPLVPFECRRRD